MHVYKEKSLIVIDSSFLVNIVLLVSGLQFFHRSVITTISISVAFAEFCIIIFWNIIPNKIKRKLVHPSNKDAEPLLEPLSSVGELVPYRSYRDSILDHSDNTLNN